METIISSTYTHELKAHAISNIHSLPDDTQSDKVLEEIIDLLNTSKYGSKHDYINYCLSTLDNDSAAAAHKVLARHLMSIPMTPADRDQLFDLWREDNLVKTDVLMSPRKNTFSDIFSCYDTNLAVKALVDDLMRVSELGQGKGEFGLSVLSKGITKQEGKGDLLINGTRVEVKTLDGGAGRFTDQEVRAAEGFDRVANEVNRYITGHGIPLPKSGLSMKQAVLLVNDPEYAHIRNQLLAYISQCLKYVFYTENTDKIVDAIASNNVAKACEEYARASYGFYMSKKEDDGMLYIALIKKPVFTVYFKDLNELDSIGMKLHPGTIYMTSVKDVRLPYPQIEIIDK